jgi:hypothetical protein
MRTYEGPLRRYLYVSGSVPQPSTPTPEIKQDQQTSEQKPDEGEATEKRTPRGKRSIDRSRASKQTNIWSPTASTTRRAPTLEPFWPHPCATSVCSGELRFARDASHATAVFAPVPPTLERGARPTWPTGRPASIDWQRSSTAGFAWPQQAPCSCS